MLENGFSRVITFHYASVFMMVVKCPRCGKETEYNGNEFRPFCSERCKLIDFGSWADEEYGLAAEHTALSEEEIAEIEKALEERQG